MSGRAASFSNDSRIVKMHKPKSTLLKDYLLDDLSSCSSNGFRSYPRRQCCTNIRYLIEIDLNKPPKLPQSKSKLRKASTVVANVFKSLRFTSNASKPNFLIRNLSRKLSNRGFWMRSQGSIKQKDDIIIVPSTENVPEDGITAVVSNDSNTSDSSDSSFTVTSDSSTADQINVSQNDVVGNQQMTTDTNGNQKKEQKNEEKDQFSPVSVMDFPYHDDNDHKDEDEDEDEDEDKVTSPFKCSHLYRAGSKQKLMSKVQRTKSLAQLKPVRLEDRITLSESKTNDSTLESSLEYNQTEKKANTLLQLLKTTLPLHDLSEATISALLGYFTERIIDGNVSKYDVLQEARDWINDQPREMLNSQNYKLAYVRDMEKGAKWSQYGNEVEKEDVGLELEYDVFTSLVEEMLHDLYL